MKTAAETVLNSVAANQRPLADRLRPARLADAVGQRHLLGEGMPLARVLESGRLHSMILWGPPGCGKTTLARILAERAGAKVFALSAVTAGLKEVRECVAAAAEMEAQGDPRGRLLFVDEAHRFNKAQQDAFLPHVESGRMIFIGATTENPSFEINKALLSRVSVYALRRLERDELLTIAERAAKALGVRVADSGWAALADFADGDARRLLGAMENAAAALAEEGEGRELEGETVWRVAGRKVPRFDKGGDDFYDQISALHKSVRGSSPDGALYWFARMLDGGADPRYVGRRLIRMASEDVGLADPRALSVALEADEAYRRLGSPEGELALAAAVVYLACVPKSDAVCRAFGAAKTAARESGSLPPPMHLRNAPTALMRKMGHGAGYRHAHDEPRGYAAGENYFPEGMRKARFYCPTGRGLEGRIAERLEELRRRDERGRG